MAIGLCAIIQIVQERFGAMSARNEAWESGLKYEYVWRFSALSVKNETAALKYRKNSRFQIWKM